VINFTFLFFVELFYERIVIFVNTKIY